MRTAAATVDAPGAGRPVPGSDTLAAPANGTDVCQAVQPHEANLHGAGSDVPTLLPELLADTALAVSSGQKTHPPAAGAADIRRSDSLEAEIEPRRCSQAGNVPNPDLQCGAARRSTRIRSKGPLDFLTLAGRATFKLTKRALLA